MPTYMCEVCFEIYSMFQLPLSPRSHHVPFLTDHVEGAYLSLVLMLLPPLHAAAATPRRCCIRACPRVPMCLYVVQKGVAANVGSPVGYRVPDHSGYICLPAVLVRLQPGAICRRR